MCTDRQSTKDDTVIVLIAGNNPIEEHSSDALLG